MSDETRSGSIIELFTRHRNASNLLLITFVLFGLFGLSRLNTQFFPTISVDAISIRVIWPGASADDVDKNIVETIQTEIRFLDNVKELTSKARYGVASLEVEFRRGTNMQKAKSDIEAAISQVTTLPKDSERPIVSQITFYEDVSSVLVSGPFDERAIKSYAKDIRDGLLSAGVDRVNFDGLRDEEIWVEVRPSQLRRYDMTSGQIAERIAGSSQDVPGGVLRGDIERQVRAVGLALTADDVGKIELRSQRDGSRILVRDVATVTDTYDAGAAEGWSGTDRAVRLRIMRTTASDAIETSEIVDQYIATIRSTLPPNLTVQIFEVNANKIIQRINVLVGNGATGMVLVLFTLFMFLNARIALWVAVGIPVSMMATFGFMWALGMSINMLSMFALIMTVGIIVDDAIVVGEHSATLSARGHGGLHAAELGAKRMLMPIIASALTTLAAFLPMLVIDNTFGDITRPIPLVLLAVLLASLAECFLILPGHLRHALSHQAQEAKGLKKKFLDGFEAFKEGRFRRFVERSYDNRYTTLAAGVGILLICIGLLSSGRVPFRFFPSPEGEVVNAYIFFQPGTPRSFTMEGARRVEEALYDAESQLTEGEGGLINTVFTQVGKSGTAFGDERAHIFVELAASEDRDIRTREIVKMWEDTIPDMAETRGIFVRERRSGPPSKDIDIRLEGNNPMDLKQAAEELITALKLFPGVTRPDDNLYFSKQELLLQVNERGAALGFNNQLVGLAARNNLQGAIAKRFARDDEEVTIRVLQPRLADAPRQLEDIDLQVPGSQPARYVPLVDIVNIIERPGFSTINRTDGKVAVTITANLEPGSGNPNDILSAVRTDVLPDLLSKYNLTYSYGGRAKDQRETMGGLLAGTGIAISLIYLILAFVFSSYSRPLVIMSVIPFGLIGTTFGHLIQGFDLTFLSLIGLLGLSGILVNNSIILISRIEERITDGEEERDAVVNGIVDRFRAVSLTSLTTVLGLAPLLFETSIQAQFLLPMVITMAWGLAFATLIVLVLVPAVLGMQSDLRRKIKGYFAKSAAAE